MYFEGTDAQNLSATIQNRFCDWLRGVLAGSPYAVQIGKPVTVTPYVTVAATLYKEQKAFVLVEETPLPQPEEWKGEGYKIRHYAMGLNLDCAASSSEAETATPGAETKADRKLVDALSQCIQDGYEALQALGLYEVEISADSERQNDGLSRFPHKVTMLVQTRISI